MIFVFTYSGIDLQGNFNTYGHTCTEQVFTTQDNIFLDLPKETPSTTEIIGMLKAYMTGSDDFPCITAKTCSYTQVAVMVASSDDTGLIGDSQIIGKVIEAQNEESEVMVTSLRLPS